MSNLPHRTEQRGRHHKSQAARILVVDDEEAMRLMLTQALSQDGYSVTAATDGQEAVEILQEEDFDLILTDIIMPRLDGVGVLRAAKRLDPRRPVIMITGYPSRESIKKMVRLGATDYIAKPFDLDLLELTIIKALEFRRHLDAASRAGGTDTIPITDSATGVYNLQAFIDLVDVELGRSDLRNHAFSILTVGIDQYRHDVAKTNARLLTQLVEVLKKTARPGDIIGRTEENEFAMILPETSREDAYQVGRNILESVDWWTISTGVSCFPQDATTNAGLIVASHASRLAEYEKGTDQSKRPGSFTVAG